MPNLDSILKSRDITLPTKVHLVKAMVFLIVMYECESWTIEKAEHQRIDAFELWCWRRLLRVPWTARRSNQSILNEISPEHSFEGLILKLNLQYFGHLIFSLFLCVDHLGRFSYPFLLFFGTLHSDASIFPFLLGFSLLFFSQLFVRPPQTAILLFCISFPWGWS